MDELAARFRVSSSFVCKLWMRYLRTGKFAALPHGGGQGPVLDAGDLRMIKLLVEEKPDRTLPELREELERRRNKRVSDPTMSRALAKLGKSRKKTLRASEGDTPTLKRERTMVRRMLNKFSLSSLLFLDESGINLSMTRTYAWANVGDRAMGTAPQNWGTTTTVVAALGLRGIVAPMVLKGAMDGETFENYVRQFLARDLRENDIVVADNLSAHKRPIIRSLIREAGAWLVYLPPYSPHLSPIELAWSKVKALLRSAAARTYDDLVSALADALRGLNPSDILGWFRHCGYLPSD